MPASSTTAALQLAPRPIVEFWCSLRSPYTYLALPRLRAWAEAGEVEVQLRPVLPMVMRGLQVPLVKRLYIIRDAKREAEELGMPFGKIADPVGRPTERGLAVLHYLQRNRGTLAALSFAESFLRGVFAEGIDAGTEAGLEQIASRAEVSSAEVTAGLADESWRAAATENREALLAAGLWGVPSFRVAGFPAQWGQDRLWVIEQQWRSKQ
jgi:2-hydroxychromene-2-carboxylate isomerase